MASFEKLVIDCEILQHMSYFLEPLTIDPAIREELEAYVAKRK